MIEWMWMKSKRLVSHLQIYDTRQQEAWLRWLLSKEFGHHLAYTLPKGMGMEKIWQDACIIQQKIIWMHGVDVTFISFIMSSSHNLHDESMRRQQTILLLGLYLREKGQICSHMFYDVVAVGDGTIMVKRGYSLALDDQEVLPSSEEFHIFSNIIGGLFDNNHVKELSYGLAGPYFHRPTTLFFWSMDLFMYSCITYFQHMVRMLFLHPLIM